MDLQEAAKTIIALKNKDLAFRDTLINEGTLGDGYNVTMAAIHNENAKILNAIINTIGYPTVDKVGKEASEAAWLVIQHAIGQPYFMKKCMKLLKVAVKEGKASPVRLAYLSDRIAVFEEKPQQYGTQFDWDATGNFSPNLLDDWGEVNRRRKSIGLNSLEEQTKIMRDQVVSENQNPPKNPKHRLTEIKKWKIKVGWIK